MSHALLQLLKPGPTVQEQVVLAILPELGDEPPTAKTIAEALTFAQDYIPPWERRPVPITGAAAGQYLGLLHTRGLVWCDPPSGVLSIRARRWYLTEAGRQTI